MIRIVSIRNYNDIANLWARYKVSLCWELHNFINLQKQSKNIKGNNFANMYTPKMTKKSICFISYIR